MDENKELWNKCVEFHGHACGGLTIGYKAALYAIERLGLQLGGGGNAGCLSPDEEIVCISENDACGVDAIQVMLGCSVGKGNLLFHMRGKQAFTFFNRKKRAVPAADAEAQARGHDPGGILCLLPELPAGRDV